MRSLNGAFIQEALLYALTGDEFQMTLVLAGIEVTHLKSGESVVVDWTQLGMTAYNPILREMAILTGREMSSRRLGKALEKDAKRQMSYDLPGSY